MMNNQNQDSKNNTGQTDQGLAALVKVLKLLFAGLKIAILLSLFGALISNMFSVETNMRAMVFRFGRLTEKEVRTDAGLTERSEIITSGSFYWAFPYPVDQVVKVVAEGSEVIRIENFPLGPSRQNADPLVPGVDGYVVTGDKNIMHINASVTYRVTDVKRYYLDFAGRIDRAQTGNELGDGARQVMSDLLTNAVIRTIGSLTVQQVYVQNIIDDTGSAGNFRDISLAVREEMQTLIDRLDLGVSIQDVTITATPPAATISAFDEVNRASQLARALVERSRQAATQLLGEATSSSLAIVADATTYRDRLLSRLQTEVAFFEEILLAYERNPRAALLEMYTSTLMDVLGRANLKFVVGDGQDGEIRIQLNPPQGSRENITN